MRFHHKLILLIAGLVAVLSTPYFIWHEEMDAYFASEAYRRWLVSDDVDEHIEQIRPYIEWGFSHLVFHFPGEDQGRSVALYAEQVLPRLRERFG